MSALMVGYARVSTDTQDLTAQRIALLALGVAVDRVYVDHGLTGTNRDRPGLAAALAMRQAVRRIRSGIDKRDYAPGDEEVGVPALTRGATRSR
jgi:Resolvase, N terminal domain